MSIIKTLCHCNYTIYLCFPRGLAYFRWHVCPCWKLDYLLCYTWFWLQKNPYLKAEDFVKGEMLDRCMPTMNISTHDNEMTHNIWNLLQHHILHLLPFLLPWFHALLTHASLFIFFLILLLSSSLCLPFSETKVKDNIYRKPPIYKQHGTVQFPYSHVSLHAVMHVTMVPVTFDPTSVCWFPFQLQTVGLIGFDKVLLIKQSVPNCWMYISKHLEHLQKVIFHAYLLGSFGIALSSSYYCLLMPSYLQIIVVLNAFDVTRTIPFKSLGSVWFLIKKKC